MFWNLFFATLAVLFGCLYLSKCQAGARISVWWNRRRAAWMARLRQSMETPFSVIPLLWSVAAVVVILIWMIWPKDVDAGKEQETKLKMLYYHGRTTIRYASVFNDLNELHLAAAKEVGLPQIPPTRHEAEHLGLAQIKSNRFYQVERLTHSVPYLTKTAKQELDRIGEAFYRRMRELEFPAYRMIVTSVLRTEEDVEKLRKINGNASDNSAHCYGTTWDITYARFDPPKRAKAMVSNVDLKTILGEILREEQQNGRIYVKYEQNQYCFHVTCRN